MVSTNLGAVDSPLNIADTTLKAEQQANALAVQDDLGLALKPRDNELSSLTRGLVSDATAALTPEPAALPAVTTQAQAEPVTTPATTVPAAETANPAVGTEVSKVATTPETTAITEPAETTPSTDVKSDAAVAPEVPMPAPAQPEAETVAKPETPAAATTPEKPVDTPITPPVTESVQPKAAPERKAEETVTPVLNTVTQQAVAMAAERQEEIKHEEQSADASQTQGGQSTNGTNAREAEAVKTVASLVSKLNAANVYGIKFNDPKGQIDMLYSLLGEARRLTAQLHWQFSGMDLPREAYSALRQLSGLQHKIHSSMEAASEQASLNGISLDKMTQDQLAKMSNKPIFASQLPTVMRSHQQAEAQRQRQIKEATKNAVVSQEKQILKQTGHMQSGMDRLSGAAVSKLESDAQSVSKLSQLMANYEPGSHGGSLFILGQNKDMATGLMDQVSRMQDKNLQQAGQHAHPALGS